MIIIIFKQKKNISKNISLALSRHRKSQSNLTFTNEDWNEDGE